jgi:hypothetical protein
MLFIELKPKDVKWLFRKKEEVNSICENLCKKYEEIHKRNMAEVLPLPLRNAGEPSNHTQKVRANLQRLPSLRKQKDQLRADDNYEVQKTDYKTGGDMLDPKDKKPEEEKSTFDLWWDSLEGEQTTEQTEPITYD